MEAVIRCAGGCGESTVVELNSLVRHDYYVCDSNKKCLHTLKNRLFPKHSDYILPSISVNAIDGFYGIDFDITIDNQILSSVKNQQPIYSKENHLLFIPKRKKLPLSLQSDDAIFEYFESNIFLSKFQEIVKYYPSDIAFEIIDNEFGTSKDSIVQTIRLGNYDHLEWLSCLKSCKFVLMFMLQRRGE